MITHGNIICTLYQGIIVGQVIEPFSVPFHSVSPDLPNKTGNHLDIAKGHHARDPSRSAHVPLVRPARLHHPRVALPRDLCRPGAMEHQPIPEGHLQASPPDTRAPPLANTRTRYRATHLSLIPSAVHQLVNHPEIKTTDLSSIMAINSGAAYLPPELATRMSRFLEKTAELTQGVPTPGTHPPALSLTRPQVTASRNA
jgi:hypothetical protein